MTDWITKKTFVFLLIINLSACSVMGEFWYERIDTFIANQFLEYANFSVTQEDHIRKAAKAVKKLSKRGAYFTTIHGNQSMMEAAAAEKGNLKILAVTALTSLDQGDIDDMGFQCDIQELVVSRAKRALSSGCDGIVASGLELDHIRHEVGEKLLIITPGIRPVENRPTDDQKRVVSVEQAFEGGADYIVVGRPIQNAEHPKQAAELIQESIQSVLGA